MKRGWEIAVVLAGCLMATPRFYAQAPADQSAAGAGQKQADGSGKKAAPAQNNPATGANPFPEDTSNVPVMPSTLTPDIPPGTFNDADNAAGSLPGEDLDPVRSPDQGSAADGKVDELESSSDVQSMDSLLPKPGEEEMGKKKRGAIDEAPKETSKEDITVGKYYMDQKNWKAAQSRFQSALVLAPEEPDVYWGLAESARHLGNFAEARANYQKVIEYDPGSRHAKEAQKILNDPEMANAKAGAKE
jgi:tetratricopeptide (TPR) repeat protein